MKICIFSDFYPLKKGGAEYQARVLANQLVDRYDIFYISHIDGSKPLELIDGIRVYKLSYNYVINKALLYYPVGSEIKSILDKEMPDIIYQRVLNSFSFHLANYSKKNKVPFFIHIADEYCLHFGKKLSDLVRKKMLYRIIKKDTKFIVQTKTQKELLDLYHVQPVLHIYNMHPKPIDEHNIIISERNIIVWIGNARKIKQLELFLELAKLHKESLSFFKFIVIGQISSDTYGLSLQAQMNDLPNLEYLGEQDNDFINNYMNKAFCLVNTSLSEGFSNTFIQAWLRGVPVISLNSDPDNIIQNYGLGYFCAGNFELISQFIEYLQSNSNIYSEISERSRKISFELFSIEKNIQKIKTILGLV